MQHIGDFSGDAFGGTLQAVSMRNYLSKQKAEETRPLVFDYIQLEEEGYHSRPGDIQRISQELQVRRRTHHPAGDRVRTHRPQLA